MNTDKREGTSVKRCGRPLKKERMEGLKPFDENSSSEEEDEINDALDEDIRRQTSRGEPENLAASTSGGEGLEFEAIRFPTELTGREGERVAFNYFSLAFSDKKVTWVNESQESGSPYDIRLESSDGALEYVEVKTTTWANREWFHLSLNEWKFGLEKGDAYIVARVTLSDGDDPKVTTYQNIEKLLKSRKLKMALFPAKQR